MKSVQLEPEALQDLRQIFVWYEAQRPGLGSELLDEFTVVQGRIAETPNSFPVYSRNTRRALMHRFPYLVLFTELHDVIVVVGIYHTSRDPTAIRKRAP